jgi:hypothetical protein
MKHPTLDAIHLFPLAEIETSVLRTGSVGFTSAGSVGN